MESAVNQSLGIQSPYLVAWNVVSLFTQAPYYKT